MYYIYETKNHQVSAITSVEPTLPLEDGFDYVFIDEYDRVKGKTHEPYISKDLKSIEWKKIEQEPIVHVTIEERIEALESLVLDKIIE